LVCVESFCQPKHLEKKAKDLKLNNVHFIGHLGEKAGINKFYNRADVLVVPSVWDEPLGLVILEAMACKTPVVVTRKGGIPLAVKDGVNGYFVRPKNASQIAQKVNKLLSNEEKRIKMGENARKIVSNLKFNNQKIELFPGQSYRNTLVVRNVGFDVKKLTAHKPHENIGKNYKDLLMSYSGPANSEVEELNQIMLNSQEQIKELNRINPTDAHMIWLWSPSFAPNLPSFSRKFGIEGAVVAGLDFMRGIAQAAKMESREIPGANGYLDSNFSEKLRYAKHFLRNNDLVYIHINAPDEEGHARSPKRKIEAIEKIDKEIVGPLYRHLTEKYGSNFRIAILSDHHTLVENGQHSDEPVPYLMYGYGFSSDSAERFTETEISTKSSIKIRSDEFMNVFIGNEK